MWYYELFCGDRFLHRSDLFLTREEAVTQAEKEIGHSRNYEYELYCTCEDEEII